MSKVTLIFAHYDSTTRLKPHLTLTAKRFNAICGRCLGDVVDSYRELLIQSPSVAPPSLHQLFGGSRGTWEISVPGVATHSDKFRHLRKKSSANAGNPGFLRSQWKATNTSSRCDLPHSQGCDIVRMGKSLSGGAYFFPRAVERS